MSTPAHSGWLNHGLAVVLAVAGAGVINARMEDYQARLFRVPERKLIEYPLRGYMDNYKREPYLASVLAKTLTDGSSILLMGSSELTTADHPAKPVNFFNDERGVPLLALGHAGNQSFSMHAQLIAAGADLANARLAILVSPSWFVDKSGLTGTELAAFLEYQPSPSLYRIQQRIGAGDPLAARVSEYMAQHEHELGSAQPIALWLARNASPTGRWLHAFSQPWNAAIIDATREEMLFEQRLIQKEIAPKADTARTDWAARYAEGRTEHLARCTNNKVFVNDDYYTEHVQGRTRQVDTHPFEVNRELRDFRGLLGYLKTMHAKPYFILQPLNPYVYINLKDVDPTINAIRDELDSHGFRYLDMWVSDTADFVPGTLTDVMHLGPLGWYRVDSAMAACFQ